MLGSVKTEIAPPVVTRVIECDSVVNHMAPSGPTAPLTNGVKTEPGKCPITVDPRGANE
jgi:hypothetical protein